MAYESEYVKLGKAILSGKKITEITLNGRKYVFNPTQIEYINDLSADFCLSAGGYGSGKSLALYIKLVLFAKMFPGNNILLGRKTLSDITRVVLPDLFNIMPPSWYNYRVKDNIIEMNNGTKIILFGLDAMQTGSVADIKKAQQKLKSLNLGAYFIDQLEEVEYNVFETLNSRLRLNDVPVRQGNMTTNPANFWGYHFFKLKQMWNGEEWVDNPDAGKVSLYQSSMLDNSANLPEDYLRKQQAMGADYVKRFVLGEWTTDILVKGTVFAKEYIHHLEAMVRNPMGIKEGCEIYEEAMGLNYQIGVDPSEGIEDPSSISVVSEHGRKVAKFNGKLAIPALIDKVKFLYYRYSTPTKFPLIIPESNAAGVALIEGIKDLRIYRRKQFEVKEKKETEKIGFRTTYSSKQALISHFQELLRTGVPKIYDRKTIEEMKVFIWNDEATQSGAGASRGFHDDDIMSTMLAFWDFSPKKMTDLAVAQSRLQRVRSFQYR
jgi:hypothetical protein